MPTFVIEANTKFYPSTRRASIIALIIDPSGGIILAVLREQPSQREAPPCCCRSSGFSQQWLAGRWRWWQPYYQQHLFR